MPDETPTPQAAPEPQAGTPPSSPGAGSGAASEAAATQEPTPKELNEFARHRRGLQEKAKQLRAGFASMKDARKAFEQEKGALLKELDELRSWRKEREKGNPLDFAEDPNKAVRDYVEKTAPERRIDQLEKALAEATAKLEEVPKLLSERDKRDAEEKTKAQQAHLERIDHEECLAFTRAIRQAGSKFYYVNAEMSDRDLYAESRRIQAWAKENKQILTIEDAGKFLNDNAKRVYEVNEARRKSLSPETQQVSSGTERPDKKTPPGNGRREERPAHATTSRKSRLLTRAEEEELDLQALRDATAKDRAARERQEKANGQRSS